MDIQYSDPYVKLFIKNVFIFKTPNIKNTLSPEWNFTKNAKVNFDDILAFKVYDYDFLSQDDFMG